jgi:dipeptidase D
VICSPLSEKEISEVLSELRAENLGAEPEMCVGVVREEGSFTALTEESHKALVSIIAENPSGVIAMSRDIPGLVETSLNLGIVRTSDERAEITYSFRSSLEAAKDELVSSVRAVAKRYGADFETRGAYPAWEYRQSSHLRDTMCRVYRETYGKDAKVITIHAGLECGIFSNIFPDIDCVSIGPDNFDIHTTEERLSLSSFERVWDFLRAVLKNI